ncbi:MAG: ABC transporter substrate-binding protein [Clostridiales Family XIII bacterium]|jgi:branched-chain amino acid transport system substrate-binding protein|nr:ABC transporter substrate-binding protein [Clostridiales Family XIII bacterium]
MNGTDVMNAGAASCRPQSGTGCGQGRRIFLFFCALLLAGAAVCLTACETYDNFADAFLNEAPPDDVVRIGVFEPLSGQDKASGEQELAGIELAHAVRAEAIGKPVELVISDNRSDIDEAFSAAKSLVEKKVSVVLGSYRSTLSIAGGSVFEEYKIPAIAVTNSNPLVTNTNDYYFRVRYVESFQGVAAAKYAIEELGISKAAVMRETDNNFAVAVSQAFADKLVALTGNPDAVVYTADYAAGTANYTSDLTEIKESGAEVVFLPTSVENGVAVVTQARRLGVEALFLGTDLWEDDALLTAADEATLSVMVFSSDLGGETAEGALSTAFARAYADRYGEDAEPSAAIRLGFDAYMLALDAIDRAGTSVQTEMIRDALARTHSFPGISGNITFDENGDPIKSVPITAVRDGAFVNIYTAEPNWGAPAESEAPADAQTAPQ